MTDSSRRPLIAICSVRGIGVAVSVKTWTSARERLQPLLMRNSEMLLLVDDHEPEPLELDAFRQDRVGADDDVDRSVGDPFLGLLGFSCRDQPG